MSYYNYYLEIKNRCLLLLLSWIFLFFVNYKYKEILLFLCIKPSLKNDNSIFYFIFTDIKEIFFIYIKLILTINNQFLVFFLIIHLFTFISLGLYKNEYTYIKRKIYTIIILWFFSLIIFNNILLPTSFNFFLSFQNFMQFISLNLHFEAKLEEYINFYLFFYCICVFYCQLFIFLIFFFDYINFNLILIKRFKKTLYCFFLCFSTIITPPDVTSQILFTFIIIFFYEIIIYVNLFINNIKNINLMRL